MLKLATPICCLLLSLSANDRAWASEAVMEDVSYNDVTGLPYSGADHKLVYGEDDPALQYGLLWLPRETADGQKAPLVTLVHGGCWLNAYDIEHSLPLASALADAGYAVWSLEYRRTGDRGGGWPGSFNDVLLGAAHARALGAYPVDLEHSVVVGHSAGGHLALLAGGRLQGLKAVIGLAAITDVVSYSEGENSCQKATLDFLGGDHRSIPAVYQAANPASQPLHPLSVLLHGGEDAIVPPAQAVLPAASTRMLEGAGHFDWIHPGTNAYQLLLSTLAEVLEK